MKETHSLEKSKTRKEGCMKSLGCVSHGEAWLERAHQAELQPDVTCYNEALCKRHVESQTCELWSIFRMVGIEDGHRLVFGDCIMAPTTVLTDRNPYPGVPPHCQVCFVLLPGPRSQGASSSGLCTRRTTVDSRKLELIFLLL